MVHRTKIRSMVALACLGAAATAGADPVVLTGTIRDFNADFQDFQGRITGLQTGLVAPTLSPGAAPTLNPETWTPGRGGITSHESFARWYSPNHDPAATTQHSITLTESATQAGLFSYRSTSFFPIDNQLLGNEGREHNYHFTYEVRSEFVYEPGQFIRAGGDDDVWIFINGQLAVDVGGVHGFRSTTLNLDTLNLTAGETYRFDLFYAERHTTAAELWLETNIGTFGSTTLIPLPSAAALTMAGLGVVATRRRRREALA